MSEFKEFLEAIKNNDFQTLTYLWEDKELLNMQDKNGDTLLHHTLKLKNIIIIQMFIGFGADLNIKNNNGITALDLLKELNNPIINAIVNSIDYEEKDYEEDYIIDCNNIYKPKNKEELMELVEDENINLGSIDTSLIKDMSYLFLGSTRKKFDGIETWDTSKVVNMRGMFDDAKYFNHNISSWNVSNVVDMSFMFAGCTNFNQPLNNWNVSNVEDMSTMFEGASKFNQPLDKWNTSNVESMSSMFNDAKSFNQDISNWDVSNVENMWFMFAGCNNFNQPLNNWNVSNVKNMNSIFSGCESFNQSIEYWKINKTCIIDNIFEDALSFKNVKSILNIYFIARGNHKKKLLSMLENCDIKEVYKEVIKYSKLKDFINKLENVYYTELKELIDSKEEITKNTNKSLKRYSLILNCFNLMRINYDAEKYRK